MNPLVPTVQQEPGGSHPPLATARGPPIRFPLAVVALLFALLVAVAAGVAFGSVNLNPLEAFTDPRTRLIVLDIRLPRVLLAAAVGAGLGAAGAAFQAVFRNPLADPFVVGSSSGGAVGAVIVFITGWAGVGVGVGPAAVGAFAGSLLAVLLVFAIAGGGKLPAESLLLAGATVSTLLGAVVWLLLAFIDKMQQVVGFLMGGLANRGWPELALAAPLIAAGTLLLSLLGRPLDALRAGDATARALGLPVGVTLMAVLGASSVAVAAAVAVGGVIGFVGLVAPHLARPLAGASHARLVPLAALVGAVLLVPADLLARTVASPRELPLGVITALAGGPVFLVVLWGSSRRHTP